MTGPEHYREAERRLALAENMFGASETYATDTNEDLDALLARIRRPSTQRAKPETSQVTPDGRSWGWLR